MRLVRLVSASVTAAWACAAAVSAVALALWAVSAAVCLATTLLSAMDCMVSATAWRASTPWTLASEFSPARMRATFWSARSASDSLVR